MASFSPRLWPFGPRIMILAVPAILLGLLILLAVIHSVTGWPAPESEKFVFLGIAILSVLPVLLALVDLIVERGAILEFHGAKLDFSHVQGPGPPSVAVPTNIGVPGRALDDTSTKEILDSLREAAASDVVVVDLEAGQGWWETRLLVLLAGAARLGRPEAIVFVGTEAGNAGIFQGWAAPRALLPALLHADTRYQQSYSAAQAAAQQWALVEPLGPGQRPPPLLWMQGLAVVHPWIAFDDIAGLPNELAPEQFLAADLGTRVEMAARPRGITLIRLQELFKPVLQVDQIDESAAKEEQLRAFFRSSGAYVPVTQRGRYQRLIPRTLLSNSLLESLMLPQRDK